MAREDWKPKKLNKDSIDELRELIHNKMTNANSAIVENVLDQLKHVNPEESNVIFIFSEGDDVITAMHTPRENLDGTDGPVLTRGADEHVILAAFSRESVMEIIQKIDEEMEKNPGLQPWAEEIWLKSLEEMAEAVKLELATNPPPRWEDTWLGEME